MVIRAPEDGVVTAVLADKGASVSPGSALASLLPAGAQLRAEHFAPSSAVGFVRPPRQVQLRYQAFPYQKFGHHVGRVLQISRSAITPNKEGAEPVYRVLVELNAQAITAYGKAEPLRPGMLLEADILGERRRLYEWLLEPLYSLQGKMDAG